MVQTTQKRALARRLRRAVQKEDAGATNTALWRAVAEAAQKGMVTCPEAPTLDEALYGLTCICAEAEHSLDDDLRASMALSEAELPVRRARWRKDGSAYGIMVARHAPA